MAVYILFKNITKEEVEVIINAVHEAGYSNSNYGPKKEDAIGLCTTTLTKNYTYLNDYMCSDNPHVSWITSRKEVTSLDDFLKELNKQIEIYNTCYPDEN